MTNALKYPGRRCPYHTQVAHLPTSRSQKPTMATTNTMKALNYIGPYQVRVEDVERPKLEHPDDVIVKVTTVSNQWIPLRKV